MANIGSSQILCCQKIHTSLKKESFFFFSSSISFLFFLAISLHFLFQCFHDIEFFQEYYGAILWL